MPSSHDQYDDQQPPTIGDRFCDANLNIIVKSWQHLDYDTQMRIMQIVTQQQDGLNSASWTRLEHPFWDYSAKGALEFDANISLELPLVDHYFHGVAMIKYLPALVAVCLLDVVSAVDAQQISPNPNPASNKRG